MAKVQDTHVKILFRYHSFILDQWTVETMWAEVIDAEKGLYKLDSIPFYGPLVASDDIIFAEYDAAEKMLTYRSTIENSGNSIVTVVIMNNSVETNGIRDIFSSMGCISEKVKEGYFAMEIPAEKHYGPIKQKLDELEDAEIIGYSEPCLSSIHQY